MKCLVVEDDALIRHDFVRTLRELGFDVLDTGRVEEAARLLADHEDLTLLVLDLHVEDGSTLVLADPMQLNVRQGVILITGSGAFPNGETWRLAPNVDYVLRKPVDLAELSAIADHITRSIS